MIKNLKKMSVYYAPVNCESCGVVTNYGESIAIPRLKPTLYADDNPIMDFDALTYYVRLCPNCYVKVTKTPKVKVPTCLSDPERRAELLERYKEE
jgi:hypothetical protein